MLQAQVELFTCGLLKQFSKLFFEYDLEINLHSLKLNLVRGPEMILVSLHSIHFVVENLSAVQMHSK